jgi:hypothetical protein
MTMGTTRELAEVIVTLKYLRQVRSDDHGKNQFVDCSKQVVRRGAEGCEEDVQPDIKTPDQNGCSREPNLEAARKKRWLNLHDLKIRNGSDVLELR